MKFWWYTPFICSPIKAFAIAKQEYASWFTHVNTRWIIFVRTFRLVLDIWTPSIANIFIYWYPKLTKSVLERICEAFCELLWCFFLSSICALCLNLNNPPHCSFYLHWNMGHHVLRSGCGYHSHLHDNHPYHYIGQHYYFDHHVNVHIIVPTFHFSRKY